jgi:hypothetical protein
MQVKAGGWKELSREIIMPSTFFVMNDCFNEENSDFIKS